MKLGVPTAPSEMSFSVQVPQQDIEWSGCDLNTVFAQRSNLLRPRFLGMLGQILRFNRLATGIAEDGTEHELAERANRRIGRHPVRACGEPGKRDPVASGGFRPACSSATPR